MAKNSYLKVIDYSVSKEEFELLYDEDLDMLITDPQPSQDTLPKYYKSEDYISHTDGKRNWFEKLYHLVKQNSLRRKVRLINSFNLESKELLDVGCGTGDFLKSAMDDGWNVTGVEPNKGARSLANEKTENRVFDIDKLDQLDENSFDVISLWHVLEHLPQLENQIAVLKKLLKPKGRIIIAVPNFKSFDARYYKSFWAAYDVPRHLWHFSKKSIESLFNQRGMILENTLPLKYDAYYVSLISEKYKSGWMNVFSAFFVASRSNLQASHTGEYSSLIYILKKA